MNVKMSEMEAVEKPSMGTNNKHETKFADVWGLKWSSRAAHLFTLKIIFIPALLLCKYQNNFFYFSTFSRLKPQLQSHHNLIKRIPQQMVLLKKKTEIKTFKTTTKKIRTTLTKQPTTCQSFAGILLAPKT